MTAFYLYGGAVFALKTLPGIAAFAAILGSVWIVT